MPRGRLSIGVGSPLVAPLSALHPYGNQIFLADLARGLAERGHRVVIYAAAGSRVEGVTLQPIEVEPLAQRRFLLLRENAQAEAQAMQRAFERLFERLRALRHDAVSQHAFDREAIDGALDTPTLHTLHLPPLSEPVVRSARASRMAFASVSRACASLWREATGRAVLALPNGVPHAPAPAKAPAPIALAAGRISREKGIVTALRAAPRAGLQAVLAGEIYDAHYFVSQVQPALDGAVFRGPLPRAELRRMMAAAAVTLMPVEWEEPFGLVAAEAQLAGCPVAGYARGALPEVVEQGVSGFLVAPGDEAALVAAIGAARALDRARIRRRAEERFGMRACVERYERALAALA